MNDRLKIQQIILLFGLCLFFTACSSSNNGNRQTETEADSPSNAVAHLRDQQTQNPATTTSSITQPQVATPYGPVVTPTPFPAVMTDISKQVETFEAFWRTVEENYIYRDFNGVDWAGIKPDYRARVDAGMTNPEFWLMLSDLVTLLGDEHSYFVSTDEVAGVQSLLRGDDGYAGVGVSLIGRPHLGDALVAWVIPNNGAHAAGLRNGDRILTVDGFPICCDGQGQPFDFLLGAKGSTTTVQVQSTGEEPRSVEITRNPIAVTGTVMGERLANDIGYIQINSFLDPQANRSFREIWDELNTTGDLAGLIIDLRTNTGGLVTPTSLILSLFVDGEIYYYYGRGDGDIPRTMRGEDIHGSQSIPLVALVGEATNSQAEVFAGVLHDTDRATLIGGSTYGNIETIRPYDLPDGSQLYLADDTLIPLSGDDWESNGLTVDIVIDQLWSEIENEDDDQALEAAIRYFE